MVVGDVHVFSGFLTQVLKPPTTLLTCFGKKFCLNRVSNSQPPGHESDTLTTGGAKFLCDFSLCVENKVRAIFVS